MTFLPAQDEKLPRRTRIESFLCVISNNSIWVQTAKVLKSNYCIFSVQAKYTITGISARIAEKVKRNQTFLQVLNKETRGAPPIEVL